MGGIDRAAEAREARWVQRQACMSIRNIVVRSPELRPVVLGKARGPSATQHIAAASLLRQQPSVGFNCNANGKIMRQVRVHAALHIHVVEAKLPSSRAKQQVLFVLS